MTDYKPGTGLELLPGEILSGTDASTTDKGVSSYDKHSFTVEDGYVKQRFVGARAYLSADQDNIADNTWVLVALNTESYDVGANFNITSNRFNAPVDGYYDIRGCVRFESNDIVDEKRYGAAIFLDGAAEQYSIAHSSAITEALVVNVSTVIHLNTDQYVQLYALQDSSAAAIDIDSNANNTYLAVYLIAKD